VPGQVTFHLTDVNAATIQAMAPVMAGAAVSVGAQFPVCPSP